MFKPVNTLQQEAIKHIKGLIINGDLKLGGRVNEAEVASLLNMSRGPIRESLRILSQEGLVTYLPRRGMFVTSLEKEDIEEIYDIRFYLEKTAVELGFHNATNATAAKLEAIVSQMESASKESHKDLLVQLDEEFHEQIISLPRYNRLKNSWESYSTFIELIFAEVFRLGSEKVDEIPHSHNLLVNALRAGNKEQFIEELRKHYFIGKEKLLLAWKQREQNTTLRR